MVLFALSCFGLLLFLWLSFGGPVPLKPKGYQVKVAFPEATQLGEQADVRVAGVSVGKLTKKDIDPKQPNRTIATLTIDRKFAPIAKDTQGDPAPEDAAGRDVRGAHARQPPDGRRGARRRRAGPRARRQDRRARRDLRGLRPADPARVPHLAADAGAGDRRPRPGPQRRLRQPARVRRGRHRPAERARQPVPGGLGRSCATRARCSTRSPRTRASCTTSSPAPARRSTRPPRARRRWRRRSRSSRRSSTSPRRRSRAWRRSPRTPTR